MATRTVTPACPWAGAELAGESLACADPCKCTHLDALIAEASAAFAAATKRRRELVQQLQAERRVESEAARALWKLQQIKRKQRDGRA